MTPARARRFAARLAAVTVPLVAALAFTTGSASAGYVGPTPTTVAPGLTAPTMTITIIEIPGTGFRVCPSGTSTVAGSWTADIDGVRSNGSVIDLSTSGYGTTFNPSCFNVTENGTDAGEWTIRLAHSRGGVTYARVGGGTWDSASGEHSWDTA